jgi:REP element-mobilizing transposase RayT
MYHVTLRGNHQQDIFFEPADRHRLSALFAEVLERFKARLHAYCYMTNHVHALVQVGDAALGGLVMRVAGQYARITQSRLHTTGHLFEKRYYPVLVDVDQYFVTLLRYMHLNPVRAGLAKSVEAYPWSSHHAYIGARSEPWVTTEFGLAQFGRERQKAIEAYRQFVDRHSVGSAERSPLLDCNPSDSRILGSDDFARQLLGAEWKPRSRRSLDALIQDACGHFHCTPAEMNSISRKPLLVAARAWVVNEAVSGRVASIAEVARRFNRDESSLRHALKKHDGTPEVFPVSRPGTE